jgi:hypothetical protein
MRPLLRFMRRPRAERRLLIAALISMSAFRAALWLLPFRLVSSLSNQSKPRLKTRVCAPEGIASAVEVASRYVPKATCLVKAFTAKMLFEKAGVPAQIRIGVSKTQDRGFEAHAWVESHGTVIVGAVDLANYTRLPPFNAAMRPDR